MRRPEDCLHLACLSIISVCVALTPQFIHADDESKNFPKRAHQLAAAEAKSFTLSMGDRALKLETQPLLRWSNPVSGQIFGDVYIWTLDGRPEAIASIYKWFSPYTHLASEFQSLSESSLAMKNADGTRVWKPSAGIKMKPLPEAPVPGTREFQRLRQMRGLAEQFTAEAVDRSDASTKWSLRLQRSPLVRYQCPNRDIIDGALFAFCQGNTNNPEVMLMLEARGKGKDAEWHYGLGRQNSIQFRARHKDALVWDVPKLAPPWPNVRKPEQPYIVLKREVDE